MLDARLRRPDRRLPPHRARADRRRSGRRAPDGRACCPPRSSRSSSKGSPDRAGSCPTAGSTSCSSSGCGATRTPSRPCTATGSGPTASSTPGPTGWGEPCWRAGCAAKGVVAVVTERNLDWMAAVLAIFKAGGVYLPIEPHFPADRIATTLTPGRVPARADRARQHRPRSTRRSSRCPASQTLLRRRRPTRRATPTTISASRSRRTSSPTSTSPPAPPVSPRARCASTRACSTTSTPRSTTWGSARARWSPRPRRSASTSRCGSWSSALLVGGRTLLVEQEVILDVERFVDTIVDGRVAVLQVVPSYLEVVLTYLEQHPRELPDLRCVSVTGEALKKELVAALVRGRARHQAGQRLRADRDLATTPTTRSWTGCPTATGSRSGRPVNNVHVYVVDEHLSPGAARRPGRDRLLRGLRRPRLRQRPRAHRGRPSWPTRTARASGSTGAATTAAGCPTASWSSSAAGTARSRSAASGSRSARSRTPCCGCPGCATAPWWSPSGPTASKHLVAFYSGRAAARGRRCCGDRLGAVAARVHGPVGLPLAGEPAADRQRQDRQEGADGARRASSTSSRRTHDAPCTPTEQRLAAAWAKVLGVAAGPDRPAGPLLRPRRHVAVGGEAGDRAGPAVSLKDVTRHPVLADLAALIDGRHRAAVRAAAVAVGIRTVRRAGALVCFPYAGGNAVNFQPMASALRGSGMAVYAVELPGHDLAAESEPFAAAGAGGRAGRRRDQPAAA